jgi:HSP20 family protein
MFDTTFARDIQQTLNHFRQSVDQLLGSSYRSGYSSSPGAGAPQAGSEPVFSPLIESGWNENEMFVRAVLPGVSERDVRVSIRGNQLVLEGERKAPGNWTKGAFTQLAYGKFYAAVTLPQGLNLEKLTCRLHDGLLDIGIPISESMKPRQVPVQTESTPAAISA